MNERNDQQAAAAPGTELESWKRGTKACAEVLGQVVRQMQDGPKGDAEALLREVCELLDDVGCSACAGSMSPMENLHGRIAAHLEGQQASDAEVRP